MIGETLGRRDRLFHEFRREDRVLKDHLLCRIDAVLDLSWLRGEPTDRVNPTPVAIREGHAVADTLFGGKPTKPDHEDVPSAVFSQPNIGTVGLSEAQARARYGAIDVYRAKFRAMKHTLSGRDEQTMMKLIVERAGDRVVGCHMVGPDAGEIIQGIGIAVKCRATKAQFDATVGIHPTSAEERVTMHDRRPESENAGHDEVPV